MPNFRIPPEGIEIDGLVWPGGKEITVIDDHWAKALKAAGAEMTHDGGMSLATPATPAAPAAPAAPPTPDDVDGSDWFKPLPPEVTDWDKPKSKPADAGDGETEGKDVGETAGDDGDGEPPTETETETDGEPPADTGNRRRPRR